MKRNADMADLSFGFQRKSSLIGVTFLEMRIIAGTLRVHEIKIEIIHTAGF